MSCEIRKREPSQDVLQLDAAREDTGVTARTRPLQRDRDFVVALIWRPPELDVQEVDHPVGPPVLDGVRKGRAVHEDAICLAGKEMTNFPVRVTQTEGRLTGVWA